MGASFSRLFFGLVLWIFCNPGWTAQEIKPNNTPDKATVVSAEEAEYVGQLYSSEDVDYYRLKIVEPTVLAVNVRPENSNYDGGTSSFSILNQDLQVLATREVKSTSKGLLVIANVLPGDIYLRAEKFSIYKTFDKNYLFSYRTGVVQSREQEPNELKEAATQIGTPGTEYRGQLSSSKDVDYYKVVVSQPTVLTVTVRPENTTYDGGTSSFSILDAKMNILASREVKSTNEPLTLSASVDVGEHFLRAEKYSIYSTFDKDYLFSYALASDPDTYTLTIDRQGNGSITSTPIGINCGATCTAAFASDTTVALTPSADSGYNFHHWTGACTGAGVCEVKMSGNQSVGAVFTPISVAHHTLTVSKTGSGTVTSGPAAIHCGASCSAFFPTGTTVSLLAQPDHGFAFSQWGGACTSAGVCVVTLDGDRSVTANFVELPKYLVTVPKVGAGIVSSEPVGILCGGSSRQCKASVSSATLTANPNAGYEFIKWTGCPAPNGNTCLITPTRNMTVYAVFKKLPRFAIRVMKDKFGAVTSKPAGLNCPERKKSCTAKYTKGTEVTLYPVPAEGRTFVGWTGACGGLGDCTLNMDGNKGVGATFR